MITNQDHPLLPLVIKFIQARQWKNELDALADSINTLSKNLKTIEHHKETALINLQKSNKKLQRATKAKTKLVANRSHEIRTPLTSIIGFSELLLEADIAPEEHENYIKRIFSSGRHLHTIVNEILDFSKRPKPLGIVTMISS